MILRQFSRRFWRFTNSEDGPTAVEYAVILALIVGGLISAAQLMAQSTRESIDNSTDAIEQAVGS